MKQIALFTLFDTNSKESFNLGICIYTYIYIYIYFYVCNV